MSTASAVPVATDLAGLADAMVRYEKAHAVADATPSPEALHDLALARTHLLEHLTAHGYEPEPEVRAQMHRDRHGLRGR